MGETVIETGMVLSATPVGEFDKRLVILTRERGRIAAFARGARRLNSPFMAGSRPFSFGSFELYEGRNSYTVSSMSISNYFTELSDDFMGDLYGFYFLELAGYYTRENVDESGMLKLLYQSLRALLNERIPDRLVKIIYELKAMAINGEAPQVFSCTCCRGEERPWRFSMMRRGVLCEECAKKQGDGLFVSEAAVYTMQYIISSTVEKLYTFHVSDTVLKELEELMELFYRVTIDKKMKSLEILKSMY